MRSSLFSILKRSVHIEAKLAKMGHILPNAPSAPKGNYFNFIRNGNIVYTAGHLPQPVEGPMMMGRLGENMTIEQGQAAARTAVLQLLSSLRVACGGDLDKVKKIIKITGFVNSTPSFTAQPQVINGCSDLIGELFGADIGRHARSAVGVNVLPLGVPVEIEAIVEISD
jgi:enamine deaminase RidA (YjgF/YER057c/UK114 family)